MLLEKLTRACGVSNYEDEVRNIILEEIRDFVDEITVDRMGNIIAVKNKDALGKHFGLSAHIDEVGLIVHSIDEKGLIKFHSLGIEHKVLVSKTVLIGEDKVKGVIGGKPIHLQSPEERNNNIALTQLYIDIGANSRDEAMKYVQIGDFVVLDSDFEDFGDNKVKGKAFDDRVGCYVIIEALKSDTKNKITACFVVQEEIGLRGSIVVANRIKTDLMLNLEATVSADTLVEKEKDMVTVLGKGPVLSLKDMRSAYLKEPRDFVIQVAEENGIPYQFRKSAMGGTDAFSYHTAQGGTAVVNISVPCRYIHSPVSVVDFRDLENLRVLVLKVIGG